MHSLCNTLPKTTNFYHQKLGNNTNQGATAVNTTQASLFVTERVKQMPTHFTLNGEPISPDDLGANNGLLPLVIIKMNESMGVLFDSQPSHLTYIEKTDDPEFFLGCKVKSFPNVPDAEIYLHLNQALMTLGRAPSPLLHLPIDLGQSGLLKTSDLAAHIAQHQELLSISERAFAQKRNENNENAL